MKKKKIKLPFNIENRFLVLILQTRIGIILSNWVTQGMRYMNKYERLYRIIVEFLLIYIVYLFLNNILNKYLAILISFLVTHTLFWLFNGHIYVLLRYIKDFKNDPIKFINYIDKIHKRVNNMTFLLAVVAFGSISKGEFTDSSDFDVRFLRRKGFINSILAFNYCTLERARAFVNAFPLDIYVFDLDEINYKIEWDEPPIIFYDPDGIISSMYKSKKIDFNEFHKQYRKKFLH